VITKHLPVESLTNGQKHHFFGYFEKFPYDKSGRYLLGHEVDFIARQPEPGEKAGICLVDLENDNKLTRLTETDAWCWQQGCMLQWLNDSETEIIYNDREGDHFVARILDVESGKSRTICRPVYCLSPDGCWALSVNFSRLDRERPGYGYPGANDLTEKELYPDNDGIFLVDLKNNTAKLIISLAQITEQFHRSDMENGPGWFNHLLFGPDSRRFAFFHRWQLYCDGRKTFKTHMFTANIDGTDIFPLNLEEMTSHYAWISPTQIIAYSNRYASGCQYNLFSDHTHKTQIIGKDIFPDDGHCSYSPDGSWMLTDTYPLSPDNCHRLYLHRLCDNQTFEIGRFYEDRSAPVPTRCDLHPRWSRDGRKVCFDSSHEGMRQIYEINVSPICG
jgi:hypothetical protein